MIESDIIDLIKLPVFKHEKLDQESPQLTFQSCRKSVLPSSIIFNLIKLLRIFFGLRDLPDILPL